MVLAGDYNVVPTDLDIYPTKSWDRNALLQPESRAAYQHPRARLDRRRPRAPSQRTDVHVLGSHAEPLGARWRSASRSHSAEFRFDGASAKRRRRSSHTRTRGRQRPCARMGGPSRRAQPAVICEPCRQSRDDSGRDAFRRKQRNRTVERAARSKAKPAQMASLSLRAARCW
jgi:hypothetical protein